jgi:hypothetical protein
MQIWQNYESLDTSKDNPIEKHSKLNKVMFDAEKPTWTGALLRVDSLVDEAPITK